VYLVIKNYIYKNKFQIYRFVFVGIITLLTQLFIFYICANYIGLVLSLSSTIAYWITTSLHFILNRNYVFNITNKSIIKQKLKYIFMIFSNYITTILGLYITVNFLKLNPYLNIIFSTLINSIFNYLFMRNFVFK